MLKATVTRVIDGDTIEVQATLRLRLDFIDAPETKGAEKELGLVSKQWLINELPQGTTVSMDIKKIDMYDRPLTVVYKGDVNINGELLKQRLAEVYTPQHHNDGIME